MTGSIVGFLDWGMSSRTQARIQTQRTASLLAVLEVHSGKVREQQSIRCNNSDTFIRSLGRLLKDYPDQGLYVAVDDGSSHGSEKTHAWAEKRIFKSRRELVQRLAAFIESYNADARPFEWTSGKPLAARLVNSRE